jgi:hypothetical protein
VDWNGWRQWLALLDQPAIQASQWLSVAAMTDTAYFTPA